MVKILLREVQGLLHTGTAISCIGGIFAQEILGSKITIRRI